MKGILLTMASDANPGPKTFSMETLAVRQFGIEKSPDIKKSRKVADSTIISGRLLLVLSVLYNLFFTTGFGQKFVLNERLSVRQYSLDDGLRQSMVSQVSQDSNSLIWMVTGDGLHCFDGKEFRAFRVPFDKGCNHSDNLLRDIAGSENGVLTLASTSSLLHFNINTGQFNVIYRKENSYPVLFSALLIEQKRVAWLNDSKICLVGQDRVIPRKLIFSRKNELPANFFPINALKYGLNEILIYSKDGFIIVNQSDRIPQLSYSAKWIPLDDCQAIAKDKIGRIFILSKGKIFQYHGNGILKRFFDTRITENMNMFIDSKDNFWLTGKLNNKLYKLSNGLLKEISLRIHDGKHMDSIAPVIISLFEDDHHNIWFGTDNDGLLVFSPDLVQFKQSLIGFTRCIAWFDNEVWAGTFNNGLWRLSPDLEKAIRVLPEHFTNDIPILGLVTDKKDRLWIATRKGIEVIDHSGKLVFSHKLTCSNAKFIYQSGDTIFVVQDSRLIRFASGNTPSIINLKDFVATSSFLSTKDAYWVGSQYGLFRSKKASGLNKKVLSETRNQISSNQVFSLLIYRGCIWAATGNGIEAYAQNGSIAPLPDCFKEISSEVVYSMIQDKQGRLWFTGNHGIRLFNDRNDQIVSFNRQNNLQSLEFNSNAVLRSPNGNLYFGGIKGINGIDPSLLNTKREAPDVRLISVNVSDSVYTKGIPPVNIKIKLDRRAPHVSGRVFCTNFTNSGAQLFSFFLEGYQQAWSKPLPDAQFMYRDLPPGNYRLLAKCADAWNNWSKPVVLLTVKINRPFWKTGWFLVLMITAIAASTAFIIKRINSERFRQQIKDLEQEHAVERERIRISKDMHDEVGANLTQISILSELAKKQQAESGNTEKIISQISEIAGNVVDEMSEIIWAMNPKNDNLDSFTAYVREYASTYLETSDIVVTFHFPFNVPALPMSAEVCRNLFLTVKEALHNVVKHSNARNVQLSLQIEGNNLKITIDDDGKGFKTDKVVGSGNGLNNMRKRIEECGGKYQLISGEKKGTEINISVTL